MSYDGRAVANFVLDFCDRRNRKVTNLALQKIIFFCHAWSLVELKKPLVRHRFEAWENGPVLRYLYDEFKEFKANPITRRATGMDFNDGVEKVVKYSFDCDMLLLLSKTVDFYSRIGAFELVRLSHVKDGPWYRVWNHKEGINLGMHIDDKDIIEYYSRSDKNGLQ